MYMSRIARFVIWICSKFTKVEIEQIIVGLSDVLMDRNPEVKPKDDFKEKHPNYRDFAVDPLPPLTEPPALKKTLGNERLPANLSRVRVPAR
jgi:hypothetical protein